MLRYIAFIYTFYHSSSNGRLAQSVRASCLSHECVGSTPTLANHDKFNKFYEWVSGVIFALVIMIHSISHVVFLHYACNDYKFTYIFSFVPLDLAVVDKGTSCRQPFKSPISTFEREHLIIMSLIQARLAHHKRLLFHKIRYLILFQQVLYATI